MPEGYDGDGSCYAGYFRSDPGICSDNAASEGIGTIVEQPKFKKSLRTKLEDAACAILLSLPLILVTYVSGSCISKISMVNTHRLTGASQENRALDLNYHNNGALLERALTGWNDGFGPYRPFDSTSSRYKRFDLGH